MKTKVSTIEELKEIIAELFFNKQSKVTKLTDESAINALFFGDTRLAQKTLKEVALVESHILVQSASGSNLDEGGRNFSSLTRFSASASSTYLLIIADSGTVYPQSTTTFTGSNGIEFQLEEDFTVDDNGYGYAKVRSVDIGEATNVDANTIVKVSPQPSGHIAVTNEFKATSGRDNESDEDFRARIKAHPNIKARHTLLYLVEVFRLSNSDVLSLQNLGSDEDGVLVLSILLQNGTSLTANELDELLDESKNYFALTDLNKQGDVVGVKLENAEFYEVGGATGVDFRVQLFDNYDIDQIRKNIQIAISRYLDPRLWSANKRIEWDQLLRIVQDTEGVRYVPDEYFNPSEDESVPLNQFPRVKRFVMRDLNGNILSDNNEVLSPIFYPNN
jgi:uncharacterized phage protein gp47/JayE